MTLQDACDAYLEELRSRNLSERTISNYRTLFKLWLAFAHERKLFDMKDYDQATIRELHRSWHVQASTAKTRYKMLNAFFSFALDIGWTTQSPMTNLKPPKVRQVPTLPLSREQFQSLALAAEALPVEKALILLMRYSGLSIGDAVICRKDAITGDTLTLHRTKTGELVIVPLPELVIQSLQAIKNVFGADYYFWAGTNQQISAVKQWRMKLQNVSRTAGLSNFRPHQLRDTFAVELLLADVQMQAVSALLGHSSVSTTERYYAPWNQARRDHLIRIVKEVNQSDSMLRSLTERMLKTQAGAVPPAPAEQPDTALTDR